MKRILLVFVSISLLLLALSSCSASEPTINGAKYSDWTIVYAEGDGGYAQRAAEYIRAAMTTEKSAPALVRDGEACDSEYKIVVGETDEAISSRLDAECEGLEFSMLAEEKEIALEGDYFVIAAAAYYFVDTYIGESATVPQGVTVREPIVKEAKNYIMLIGDGMGVYQSRLFEHLNDVSDYSDGEDIFYGYMLPYIGSAKTTSLSGVTDSAAAGTALASGYKTYNDFVGRDKDGRDVKLLPELALELSMGAAVMSTEDSTGATPAAFSSHTASRDNYSEILDCQDTMMYTNGGIVECNFNQYDARGIEYIEGLVTSTLEKLEKNENGFFLMYEEAHIDKHSHKNDMHNTFLALIRFNQVIARFMEYAFYNPDTFVLITADHETGSLLPNSSGELVYGSEKHSDAEVPVFAYGAGAEVFDGVSVDNTQIPKTIAKMLGVSDFGDPDGPAALK